LSTDSEQKLETNVKVFEQSFAGHPSESESQANDVSEQSPGTIALTEMEGVQSEAATRGGQHEESDAVATMEKAELGIQLCNMCRETSELVWNVSCTGTSAMWPGGNIIIDGSRRRSAKCFHPHYDSDEGFSDGFQHWKGSNKKTRGGYKRRKTRRMGINMCKCLHKYMTNCESSTDGTCMQNEFCQCQSMCKDFKNQLSCTSRLSSLRQRAGSPDQAELSVAEEEDALHGAPEKSTQQTSQLMRTLVSRSSPKAKDLGRDFDESITGKEIC